MNISTIRSAVYSWARANANVAIPVVWAEQNAPAPARPYVTLRLSGPFRVAGRDELRPNRDAGNTFAMTGPRRFSLIVQVFGNPETDPIGDNSLAIAIGLNASLGKTSTLESLRAANLAVSAEGNVENITAPTPAGLQPRATFAAELLTVEDLTDGVTWIETYDGTIGEFQ